MSFAKRGQRPGQRRVVQESEDEGSDDAPAIKIGRAAPKRAISSVEDEGPGVKIRKSKASRVMSKASKAGETVFTPKAERLAATPASKPREREKIDLSAIPDRVELDADDDPFAHDAPLHDLPSDPFKADPGFATDTRPGVVDLEVDAASRHAPVQLGGLTHLERDDKPDDVEEAKRRGQVEQAKLKRQGKRQEMVPQGLVTKVDRKTDIRQQVASGAVCAVAYDGDDDAFERHVEKPELAIGSAHKADTSAVIKNEEKVSMDPADVLARLEKRVQKVTAREHQAKALADAHVKEQGRLQDELDFRRTQEKQLLALSLCAKDLDQYLQNYAAMIGAQGGLIENAAKTLGAMEVARLGQRVEKQRASLADDRLTLLGEDGEDRFGRSTAMLQQARVQSCASRERKLALDAVSEDDEEEDEDRLEFCRAAEEQLLGEVHADFSSFKQVVKPFQALKRDFLPRYRQAYVPLCLEEAFAPLVAYELLWWDPLGLWPRATEQGTLIGSATLDVFEWYSALMDYTTPEDNEAADPDDLLVPSLVRALVNPRVRGWIEAWDCSSRSQTQGLVAVVKECELYAEGPRGEQVLVQLLAPLPLRLEKYLEEMVPAAAFAKARGDGMLAKASAQARLELAVRTVKVVENTVAWRGVLNDGVLQNLAQLALEKLGALCEQLGAAEGAQSTAFVEAVQQCLPSEWSVDWSVFADASKAACRKDAGLIPRWRKLLP